MKRNMIQINEELCNGCEMCVSGCHEGAIVMVNGKAKLIREDYCDGLGDCLPSCPTGAITIVEQEALPYNEQAVQIHLASKSGCPSANIKMQEPVNVSSKVEVSSQLQQWPIQIKLVPSSAPFFEGANLLIAADCSAFAYANFHQDFIKNHVTIIGCPKLDQEDYTNKLLEIISNNNIKSMKVVRMEVPCCGGIEQAAKQALLMSGKFIPWQVVTVSTNGELV